MALGHKPGTAITGKIKHLEAHPVSEAFPMMSEEARSILKESIREHKQRQPIVLSPDGRIVDGRARYLCCAELGIEPVTITLSDSDSLVMASIEYNACRRDLTQEHRMEALRILWPHYEAESLGRQRRGGTLASRDAKVGENGGRTRDQLSSRLGLSPATITRATKVFKKGTKKLQSAMARGRITPTVAAKAVDLSEDLQDLIGESEDPKATVAAVVADPPKVWPKDERGIEIPESLQGTFARIGELNQLKSRTDALRRDLAEMGKKSLGVYLNSLEIDGALRMIANQIHQAAPYAVCPSCGGDAVGCDSCHRQGWVTKNRFVAMGERL